MDDPHVRGDQAKSRRWLRRAWWSLALLPLAYVVATVTQAVLLSYQGYETGGYPPIPLPVAVRAAVPAVALLVAPGLAALGYGWRARRGGTPAGRTPAVIGAAVVIAVLVSNGVVLAR